MKPRTLLGVLLVGFVFTAGALAADHTYEPAMLDNIERSLAMALQSNSPGMQIAAALTVREMKHAVPDRSFDLCIIPLMHIVKEEWFDPGTRVTAALALYDLRSARGDFAIKRTGMFTDVPRLRHACQWLTIYRTQEK